MTKNDITIDELLANGFKTAGNPFDGKFTKTSMFLLNTFGINIYGEYVRKFFVNAYLNDCEYEHRFTNPVFVLFKTKSLRNKEWLSVYRACMQRPEFITDYDCGIADGENLIMVVFEYPEAMKKDYYAFKRGKYSKFSEEFRTKIPETVTTDNGKVKSLVYNVINRTPYMQEKVKELFGLEDGFEKELDEYWSKPTVEREFYRFKQE